MKSDLPKGLHRVCGVPMVALVANAMREAGIDRIIVVVGHGGELIQNELGSSVEYAWQHEQLGTGHAAMQVLPLLQGFDGNVVISPGDTPLVTEGTFRALLDHHAGEGNDFTLVVAELDDPTGYGRVLRDAKGSPCRIVEEKDATPEQRATREVNPAFYCIEANLLAECLSQIRSDNVQNEFYLTDVLDLAYRNERKIGAVVSKDASILVGVNDRWQLAEAAKKLRVAILRRHALSGVTFVDPDTTYVEPTVSIGLNSTIEPGTILEGMTTIGAGCHIGPNTKIQDSSVGEHCVVLMSHLNEATMLDGCRCGPYANLRPGSVIGPGSKIGNFVEVKNAQLAANVSVSHLSYIGDGEVGEGSNIGAGTIFCNYDGFTKSRTSIGANVFVGSNSTLVAPIRIGDGAFIGAGSVITRDVSENALALGRARQEEKEGWALRWRESKKSLNK